MEHTESSKPKAQPIVGIALTVLAVLLIAGVATFAGPCGMHVAGEVPSCQWASRAVIGAGVVVFVLAVVRVFETDEGERRGLSLSCALIGFLIAFIPGFVIGLCTDSTMQCNAVMRPFVMCVGVAIGMVGGVDLTRRLLAIRMCKRGQTPFTHSQ